MPLHDRQCAIIGGDLAISYRDGGSAARCLFGSGGQVPPCHGLTDGINPVIGSAKDSLLVIGKAGCINHINIAATNEFQNELHKPCGKFIASTGKRVV